MPSLQNRVQIYKSFLLLQILIAKILQIVFKEPFSSKIDLQGLVYFVHLQN